MRKILLLTLLLVFLASNSSAHQPIITGGTSAITVKNCTYNESVAEYNWKHNNVMLGRDKDNIPSEMFSYGDTLQCAIKQYGAWEYSDTITITDGEDPIPYNFTIKPDNITTNTIVELCHKTLDDTQITDDYFEIQTPLGTINYSATYISSRMQYCHNLMKPVEGDWQVKKIISIDSAGNKGDLVVNHNFIVTPVKENTSSTTTTTTTILTGVTSTTIKPKHWTITNTDTLGPSTDGYYWTKGSEFTDSIDLEKTTLGLVKFNITFSCNETFCMDDWCGGTSFEMDGISEHSEVLTCNVPLNATTGEIYKTTIVVTACGDNCTVRTRDMKAIIIEGVFLSQYSSSYINTPILFSFTESCDNIFCQNIEGKPIKIGKYTWSGFTLWQILLPGLFVLFIITISAAIENRQYPFLWGSFILGELIAMVVILYVVLF